MFAQPRVDALQHGEMLTHRQIASPLHGKRDSVDEQPENLVRLW